MNTARHPEAETALERLLGRAVDGVELVQGGRNSRVFKFSAGRPLVAKFYHRSAADGRDRLGVELASLRFLWKNGLRRVPEPVAADAAAGVAVYAFVPGRKITGAEATPSDLEQAAEFAGALRGLRAAPGAPDLPPASEARFSVAGVVENLRSRAARLDQALIDAELRPALDRLAARAERMLDAAAELEPAERTLSHSDFGFHNALRGDDGVVRFVDFEYFGWDDPAKMISDFMLQPVVGLDAAKRQAFFASVLRRFPGQALEKRVAAVYPLFALKWALIMLNDFTPGARERRAFAGAAGDGAEQLEKARALIARALQEEDFPYHG